VPARHRCRPTGCGRKPRAEPASLPSSTHVSSRLDTPLLGKPEVVSYTCHCPVSGSTSVPARRTFRPTAYSRRPRHASPAGPTPNCAASRRSCRRRATPPPPSAAPARRLRSRPTAYGRKPQWSRPPFHPRPRLQQARHCIVGKPEVVS
jgi:hypothetical protein